MHDSRGDLTVPLDGEHALATGRIEQTRALVVPGAVPRQNFLYWAIVTAIYAKAGFKLEAEAAKAELLAIYPDFAEHAIAELRKRSVAPDLAAQFIEAWRLARLEILAPSGI